MLQVECVSEGLGGRDEYSSPRKRKFAETMVPGVKLKERSEANVDTAPWRSKSMASGGMDQEVRLTGGKREDSESDSESGSYSEGPNDDLRRRSGDYRDQGEESNSGDGGGGERAAKKMVKEEPGQRKEDKGSRADRSPGEVKVKKEKGGKVRRQGGRGACRRKRIKRTVVQSSEEASDSGSRRQPRRPGDARLVRSPPRIDWSHI